MNYNTLRTAIAAAIKTPADPKISGAILQQQLINIVNALDLGSLYLGIASTNTVPNAEANGFYFATTEGTYTNFSNIVINENEVAIIYQSGNGWAKEVLFTIPQDGADGESAYQIAVDNGFVGSEEQWLASLKANIGEFQFITPTDTTAEAALTTIGSIYASAIGGVSPSQSTLSVILLMNDSNNTKTMMIATQDDGNSGFEFIYAGDLQSAMPSNVLTEDDIDNSFAGGSGKVAGADEVSQLEVKVDGNVSQLTQNLSATDNRAVFNGEMAGQSGKIANFSISGIDAGTFQILNSSWSVLLEKAFISGGNVTAEIPENAQHLIVYNENKAEIGHTTTVEVDVTIFSLQDGINYSLDKVKELQGGLPTINIFNISELFPTGGTGGTNVYTAQAARNKVPAEKRKKGLIISYLTSGGWVIEQAQYTSYDATSWQWSNTVWMPITPAIVNLNSVQRKTDAFADAGTARGNVPVNLRLNPLGLLVTYLLSDGWYIDICTSSTFNAGQSYWKHIVSGSSVNIDDGAISTAKLADKAVSMPKLADDVIFKMDYIMGEGKDAPSVASVDLANIGWTYGAYIDSATGQVRSHEKQAVSELIPISPLTTARLFSKTSGQNTDYRVMRIVFYNMSENGTITFLQGKDVSTDFTSSVRTCMTPSNANAVRINLMNVVGGVQQVITSADLTDENYSLSASVPDAFSMPKKGIVIPRGIVDLSSADNWQQGDFFSIASTAPTSLTAVWSVRPIEVNEGHKYLIPLMPVFDSDGHMIYQLRVVYMSDLDTVISRSELLWYANAIFTAPKDCKYIHIIAYGDYNQQHLLPSQMPMTHLSIVDITEFCGSFKSAEKKIVFNSVSARYGQSIAYYNGYIFHGWSNGDLDVFDKTFNLVASSTLSPATGESGPVHCNVLAFSDDFYEEGDDFPVLWISNNGTSEQKMLGVRIQLSGSVLTLTNVYELPAPAVPDNHRFYTQYFDFKAKQLIVQSYESVSASNLNYCGSTLIEVYSYTDKLMSSSEFTKVSSVDVFPRYYPFQGGLVADNHLFATIGTNGTTRMIASINLTSGVIDSMIYLPSNLIGLEAQEEPQGFAFFNGILLLATVHGLYLLTP